MSDNTNSKPPSHWTELEGLIGCEIERHDDHGFEGLGFTLKEWLRIQILDSEWLAAHDAEVRAEAEAERDAALAVIAAVRADLELERVGMMTYPLGVMLPKLRDIVGPTA